MDLQTQDETGMQKSSRFSILPDSVTSYKSTIIKWGLVGFFIRIAIMPLFAHPDMILIARTGVIMFESHQLAIGPYPAPITLLFACLYALFSPILPHSVLSSLNSNTILTPQSLFSLYNLSRPGILTFIFVSKLPYLACDLGIALLLLHIVSTGKKALFAFELWMLNPIAIFISYGMGQFDIIPAFFLVLAIYFFKKQKALSSILAIGISGALKLFGLLFILPGAVTYLKPGMNLRSKAKKLSLMLAVGLLPILLSLAVSFVLPTYYESANLASPISAEIIGFFGKTFYVTGYAGNVFPIFLSQILSYSVSFPTYSFDVIYAVPFIYGLFLLGMVYVKEWSFEKIPKAFLAFLLAYYAFSLFHPQWFLFALPLLVLLVAENRERYFGLYILLVFLYFIFVGNFNDLYRILVVPIFPHAYFWPGQITLLNSVGLPGIQIVNVFRSILSALFVVLIALILGLDQLYRNRKKSALAPVGFEKS